MYFFLINALQLLASCGVNCPCFLQFPSVDVFCTLPLPYLWNFCTFTREVNTTDHSINVGMSRIFEVVQVKVIKIEYM